MKLKQFILVPLAAALLAGCPAATVRLPEARGSLPTLPKPDLGGATVYSVDPTASDLQIRVFRGGTLARLGHNHVMTSKHLSGRIWSQAALERSGFELEFPVAELIVDDPQARAAAGTEFPGEIPADDRAGTRKNMLRAEVLDAEHYPTIKLASVRVEGSLPALRFTTRITIKDVSRDVLVPASVAIEDGRLIATGRFDILQTHFGIKPFSIGLGALEVQDRLHVEFGIVATK